jgi:hypothetical protein
MYAKFQAFKDVTFFWKILKHQGRGRERKRERERDRQTDREREREREIMSMPETNEVKSPPKK